MPALRTLLASTAVVAILAIFSCAGGFGLGWLVKDNLFVIVPIPFLAFALIVMGLVGSRTTARPRFLCCILLVGMAMPTGGDDMAGRYPFQGACAGMIPFVGILVLAVRDAMLRDRPS